MGFLQRACGAVKLRARGLDVGLEVAAVGPVLVFAVVGKVAVVVVFRDRLSGCREREREREGEKERVVGVRW